VRWRAGGEGASAEATSPKAPAQRMGVLEVAGGRPAGRGDPALQNDHSRRPAGVGTPALQERLTDKLQDAMVCAW
jgi:hypothetical protein